MAMVKKTPPAPVKHRSHLASPFYLYCQSYVEEQASNGRRFRTEEQGFERAALTWNELSTEQKEQWKLQCFEERRQHFENGTIQKMKIPNGDRGGEKNTDTTVLGRLKNLSMKKNKDVDALYNRWLWSFGDNDGILHDPFLIMDAVAGAPNSTAPFLELAVVQFDLASGIKSQFHVKFGPGFVDLTAVYEAILRVLTWPTRIDRRLNQSPPVLFVPPGRMASVFDALSFVEAGTTNLSIFDPKTQISLATDLAEIGVLADALAKFLRKPTSNVSISGTPITGNYCALTEARRWEKYILKSFGLTN